MPPMAASFARPLTAGAFGNHHCSLLASSTLTANVTSCDTNGALDNGGTGLLTITLHNDGACTPSSITATVTSTIAECQLPQWQCDWFPDCSGIRGYERHDCGCAERSGGNLSKLTSLWRLRTPP